MRNFRRLHVNGMKTQQEIPQGSTVVFVNCDLFKYNVMV